MRYMECNDDKGLSAQCAVFSITDAWVFHEREKVEGHSIHKWLYSKFYFTCMTKRRIQSVPGVWGGGEGHLNGISWDMQATILPIQFILLPPAPLPPSLTCFCSPNENPHAWEYQCIFITTLSLNPPFPTAVISLSISLGCQVQQTIGKTQHALGLSVLAKMSSSPPVTLFFCPSSEQFHVLPPSTVSQSPGTGPEHFPISKVRRDTSLEWEMEWHKEKE